MIIVTGGHVDHGKTSLLQALTGTHTAHLPEEKKRGLTIDLGYAYLPLEKEGKTHRLGFIDVPGHQKFLSNMLAGLGGIQHALLVVSAEEGIKPQTEEHLAIFQLLRFTQIMVAITKADRVEQDRIDQVIADLKQRFPLLNDSPIFITSAQTGRGIADLKTHFVQLIEQHNTHQDRPFRYAIDRVFNVKGVGLVVTGTAIQGKVSVGDELYLSSGEKVKIKGIHAQNQENHIGLGGQRLALNITNIEKENITRGEWLSELFPYLTDRITVKLNAHQPLKENNVVHLYHFSSHITGKLNLLETKQLETKQLETKQAVKNQECFAEIILDNALPIAVFDKLIIRRGDDSQTLAGAEVLEIFSPKRYKRSPERLALVKHLAKTTACLQDKHSLKDRLQGYLTEKALEIAPLLWAEQWKREALIDQLTSLGVQHYQQWIFSETFKQHIQTRLIEKLKEYHTQHQDQLGVTKARLYRIATLNQAEKLVYAFIDELVENNVLAQTRGWLHLPEHRIEFNAEEEQKWQQIKPLFEATNQALWVRDIANTLNVDETEMRNLLYKAGKLGYLIPIVKDRFLLNEQIEAFALLIKAIIQRQGDISVNQLRDEIQYGRKLTVQLIEYFDRSGFLRRKGNVHLLRDGDSFSHKK